MVCPEMDQVGLKRMTGSAKMLMVSMIPWLAVSCVVLWRSYGLPGRVACVVVSALQLAIGAIMWRGKAIDDGIQERQLEGTT